MSSPTVQIFQPGIEARRHQHREIGLAASGRESAGDVVRAAFGALHAHDQHVLGEPAFVARLPARDAQRVALLAEQRVAAVAGADALDRELFREVHDEAAVGIQIADRVQALHERAVALDPVQRGRAHARHDAHVDHDVGAVGDLHAAARERRVDRPHAVRDHIHRAAAHRAVEQRIDFAVRFSRIHPVVVRTGVVAVARADERQVLDASDVGGTGAMQVTIRVGGLVELDKIAAAKHRFDQCRVFGVRPGAPVNRIRLGQSRDLLDPTLKRRIRRAHLDGILLRVDAREKQARDYTGRPLPSHCAHRQPRCNSAATWNFKRNSA